MKRLRRHAKPLAVIAALIAVSLVFSACAFFKQGSLSLSQPGGVGSVRVHFVLCTEPESTGCNPSEDTEEVQYLLGIAVPPGSTPPPTVSAVPVGGGSPLVFTLNDEVATEIASASAHLKSLAEKEGEGDVAPPVWPPAGLQGVGYLSNPHLEQEGVQLEWNVDADFGLPAAADGSPFPGPFATGLTLGTREVGPGQSPSRPVDCWGFESEPTGSESFCIGTVLQGQVGTSDLKSRHRRRPPSSSAVRRSSRSRPTSPPRPVRRRSSVSRRPRPCRRRSCRWGARPSPQGRSIRPPTARRRRTRRSR